MCVVCGCVRTLEPFCALLLRCKRHGRYRLAPPTLLPRVDIPIPPHASTPASERHVGIGEHVVRIVHGHAALKVAHVRLVPGWLVGLDQRRRPQRPPDIDAKRGVQPRLNTAVGAACKRVDAERDTSVGTVDGEEKGGIRAHPPRVQLARRQQLLRVALPAGLPDLGEGAEVVPGGVGDDADVGVPEGGAGCVESESASEAAEGKTTRGKDSTGARASRATL